MNPETEFSHLGSEGEGKCARYTPNTSLKANVGFKSSLEAQRSLHGVVGEVALVSSSAEHKLRNSQQNCKALCYFLVASLTHISCEVSPSKL